MLFNIRNNKQFRNSSCCKWMEYDMVRWSCSTQHESINISVQSKYKTGAMHFHVNMWMGTAMCMQHEQADVGESVWFVTLHCQHIGTCVSHVYMATYTCAFVILLWSSDSSRGEKSKFLEISNWDRWYLSIYLQQKQFWNFWLAPPVSIYS